MWRERVKQQLQQETQRWLDAHGAAGVSSTSGDHGALRILSISKLLQIVSSPSVCDSSEQQQQDGASLAAWGIQRVELQPNGSPVTFDHPVKRSRSQDNASAFSVCTDAGSARQIAYSSDRAWITGFLRVRDAEKQTGSDLHLADASDLGCQALVVDPQPELVDQLVLVKKWVLIGTRAAAAAASATSQCGRFSHLFLEVHEPPTILHQSETQPRIPSRDEVRRLLDAHYPTQDPPLYIGPRPWRTVVHSGREEPVQSTTATATTTAPGAPAKRGKTKKTRVHAVFGRVVCVSPVSNQHDRSSCHFFAEIEFQNRERRRQNVVNIMFAGAQSVRWRLFLRPGVHVLVTDLVKVFSRECGIFLLQTTATAAAGVDKAIAEGPAAPSPQLGTQVLVWQQHDDELRLPSRNVEYRVHQHAEREVVDCEGVITRVLWNDCLEVQSGADSSANACDVFVVCLFHFPSVDLAKVRVGATVRILSAHVLRQPNPIDRRAVIGLCARSHFSVVAHGRAPQQCVQLQSSISSRHCWSKKLSYFGDRRVQPLPVSMWLFEVFEALVNKFSFGSSTSMPASLQETPASFPHTRRREALRIFAEAFEVDVIDSQQTPVQSATLGGRFLSSHAEDAGSCSSVHSGKIDGILRGTLVAIRDMEKWARARLAQAFADEESSAKTASRDRFCVQIPAEDLDWCLLVGCLSGNTHSDGLEICDRTGSLPLSIVRGSQKVILADLEDSRHLHVIRKFELFVEAYCSPGVPRDFEQDAVIIRASCTVDAIERIRMGSSDSHGSAASRCEQELTVLITHVDPVRRSSVLPDTLRRLRPAYRHVHAITLPMEQSGETRLQSPGRIEFMINVNTPHWHVEKHGCYRVTGAFREEDAPSVAADRASDPAATVEEKSIVLAVRFLAKAMEASSMQTVCFEEFAALVNEFDAPHQSMRGSRLKLYRLEPSCSIAPLRFEARTSAIFTCPAHDGCARPRVNEQGLLDFSRSAPDSRLPSLHQVRLHNASLPLKRSMVELSPQQLVLFSLLQHFALGTENVVQVADLLQHPLPQLQQQQQQREDNPAGEHDIDIHRMRLYSIVGVVVDKKYYWVEKPHSPVSDLVGSRASSTSKKKRENGLAQYFESGQNRELMCRYQVRDLFSPNTIDVRANASRFGVQASLQPRSIVEFSKLQGFIARSTYKVYMNWGNCSSACELQQSSGLKIEAPSEGELYGSMGASLLNGLYQTQLADRTLHRWVVRVVYVSYVVLKRKCRKCHRALQLEKHRACWTHRQIPASLPSSTKQRNCSWHQVRLKDPRFDELTYAGMSMRCVVDDGSAQAELFLENDVAWDLLACSTGARRRFEEMVRSHSAELSYFTGQSSAANAFFSSSSVFRDDEYYQNEFRSMIVDAMQRLRSVVVFGQRFYSPPRASNISGTSATNSKNETTGEREFVSVLTFGKDIQITTKSVASVQLEARRVDSSVPVKSELREKLAKLRLGTTL